MIYNCIKFLARCGLLFFFRRRITCGFPLHMLKGPAIIAANHPNSMLDAVILGCLCKQQVHFTIRSDMFHKPLFRSILKFLNAIPVYRITEEKNRMRENFNVIDQCREILKKDGIIIIFSEGITVHEWKLKSLKSGTSRIVQHALLDDKVRNVLQVVPVGLTYSDYRHPGKTLIIQTGEIFYPGRQEQPVDSGAWKLQFNSQLYQKLHPLVPELTTNKKEAVNIWQILITNITPMGNRNGFIPSISRQSLLLSAQDFASPLQQRLKRFFLPVQHDEIYKSYIALLLLTLPALAGLILNGLFYFPVDSFVRAKTKNTIYFDSLFFGMMVILYPAYLLLLSVFLGYLTPVLPALWLVLIPVSGWCSLQCWIFVIKIKNHLNLTGSERSYLIKMITGLEVNSK